jgi:hypothetical protein
MNERIRSLSPRLAVPVLFLLCTLLGFTVDFVFNGVLKIIWVVIYLPCYFALGATLWNWLVENRWSQWAIVGVAGFALGCLGTHFAFNDCHRIQLYHLALVGDSPVALRSKDWPETLFVTSEKLSQILRGWADKNDIPVTALIVTDYGCTKSTRMVAVAGFNIDTDPDTNWVWKDDDRLQKIKTGPGSEDRYLPWCRLKFYRGISDEKKQRTSSPFHSRRLARLIG